MKQALFLGIETAITHRHQDLSEWEFKFLSCAAELYRNNGIYSILQAQSIKRILKALEIDFAEV